MAEGQSTDCSWELPKICLGAAREHLIKRLQNFPRPRLNAWWRELMEVKMALYPKWEASPAGASELCSAELCSRGEE